MAIVSNTIARYNGNLVTLSIVYNDANNAVQSATVVNNSSVTVQFQVWLMSNPANKATITVLPGATNVYTNLPGGVRYSPVELPEGDPRATNFEYSRIA